MQNAKSRRLRRAPSLLRRAISSPRPKSHPPPSLHPRLRPSASSAASARCQLSRRRGCPSAARRKLRAASSKTRPRPTAPADFYSFAVPYWPPRGRRRVHPSSRPLRRLRSSRAPFVPPRRRPPSLRNRRRREARAPERRLEVGDVLARRAARFAFATAPRYTAAASANRPERDDERERPRRARSRGGLAAVGAQARGQRAPRNRASKSLARTVPASPPGRRRPRSRRPRTRASSRGGSARAHYSAPLRPFDPGPDVFLDALEEFRGFAGGDAPVPSRPRDVAPPPAPRRASPGGSRRSSPPRGVRPAPPKPRRREPSPGLGGAARRTRRGPFEVRSKSAAAASRASPRAPRRRPAPRARRLARAARRRRAGRSSASARSAAASPRPSGPPRGAARGGGGGGGGSRFGSRILPRRVIRFL